MIVIKKFDRISIANYSALFYALTGMLVSLSIAISAIANMVYNQDLPGSFLITALFNLGLGIVVGLISAVIMGLLGWLMGFIFAAIYNIFSRRIGGVKMELEEGASK